MEYNHKLIMLLVYGFHLFVVSAHDTFLGIVNHIYLGHFEFVWSLSLQHFKATAWLWAFKMWKYNLYFAYCHRWVTSIHHFNCEPMFVTLTLREIQLLFWLHFNVFCVDTIAIPLNGLIWIINKMVKNEVGNGRSKF